VNQEDLRYVQSFVGLQPEGPAEMIDGDKFRDLLVVQMLGRIALEMHDVNENLIKIRDKLSELKFGG